MIEDTNGSIYGIIEMSKIEKILAKMRNTHQNWHIEDVKIIANRFAIEYRQPGTSHVTFRTIAGEKLTIPAHKPIKPIYIKKFMVLIDSLGGNNESIEISDIHQTSHKR